MSEPPKYVSFCVPSDNKPPLETAFLRHDYILKSAYDALKAENEHLKSIDKTDHRYHPSIDRIEELETQLKNLERAAEKKVKAAEDDALAARNSAKYWADRILIHERAAEGLVDVCRSILASCGQLHTPIYFIHLREALAAWEARNGK